MKMFLSLSLLSLLFVSLTPCVAQSEFYSGYAGTLPTDPKDLARTYFNDPVVRGLILELADGPITPERAQEILKGTRFTLQDLLRLKLIVEREGRLFIGFSYFSSEDMKTIDRVAAVYVPSLIHAYLDHQKDLEQILSQYPESTVSAKKLAFILIAGFSLNWDGLKITQEEGYRKPLVVQGNGWSYSFWAEEDVPGRSTKEFYWGSSTFPLGKYNFTERPADYSFSSFGDPFSDPRMNFPDLLYTSASDMAPAVRSAAEKVGLIHETSLGTDIPEVLGFEFARDAAAILFALRGKPATEAELAGLIRDPKKIDATLSLLQEIQYIERDKESRYHLRVPVFDTADQKMVNQTVALSRQIIAGWLKSNFRKMQKDLGTLTAMRQGVPFESLLTQIWHEWFGLTTRELVKSGFLFDPYGKDASYKGSFSALWRRSLYDFNP